MNEFKNDSLRLSPKIHLKTWGLGVTVCNPSTGENTEGSLGSLPSQSGLIQELQINEEILSQNSMVDGA